MGATRSLVGSFQGNAVSPKCPRALSPATNAPPGYRSRPAECANHSCGRRSARCGRGRGLFGDILTGIGSALSCSLGIAPGANINPTRTSPSMFEPIHGSAPDIAGKGIANPIGAIWAGALMLEHLGHRDLHDKILGAIERVVATGKVRTPDLGGSAKTAEVAAAITGEI